MDKNMIHIDDLFRQRLDGGQEPERPGAWLTMRELLDKEMPVAAANSSNRRRIIGYFTGLLLLTTATVGGYKMYNSQVNYNGGGSGSPADDISIAALSNKPNNNSLPNDNNHHAENGIAPAALPAPSDTHSSDIGSITTGHQSTENSLSPATQDAIPDTRGEQAMAAVRSSNNTAANGIQRTRRQTVSSSAAHAAPAVANSHPENNNAGITQHAVDANSAASAASEHAYASAAGATLTSRRVVTSGEPRISAAGNKYLSEASNTPNAAMTTRVSPAPIVGRTRYAYDTIETIEIVARRVYDANIQRAVFRIDTVPRGKTIVARVLPSQEPAVPATASVTSRRTSVGRYDKNTTGPTSVAANKSSVSSGKSNQQPLAALVPAANISTKQSADGSTVDNTAQASLNSAKSSGNRISLWEAMKLAEAIEKAKSKMARIQMYPGLIGGINASLFTPNSLGGFQMGLTSLFVLNDWWTLMAELKYLHRFNTGNTLHDDYKSVVNSTTPYVANINGESYKVYEWQDRDVEHYFNYDVVQTFELPLALRYSWGRFFAQGGLNFVYSNSIKASEVTHNHEEIISHRDLRPANGPTEKFISNDAPLVAISDFGSRFGTGYTLGGGFMFTPAVYLDFRVAQTFWDNAKTSGAKQISKDLLRTPSIQLSVGYRFSQQKK